MKTLPGVEPVVSVPGAEAFAARLEGALERLARTRPACPVSGSGAGVASAAALPACEELLLRAADSHLARTRTPAVEVALRYYQLLWQSQADLKWDELGSGMRVRMERSLERRAARDGLRIHYIADNSNDCFDTCAVVVARPNGRPYTKEIPLSPPRPSWWPLVRDARRRAVLGDYGSRYLHALARATARLEGQVWAAGPW